MERVDVIDVLCRAEADAAKNSHLGLGDHKCAEIMAARLAVAELIEALEAMLAEFNELMTGVVHDELAAIRKARAALSRATETMARTRHSN